MRLAWMVAVLLLLAGCASAPKPVGDPIEGSPSVRKALAQPDQTKGQRVRWGGTIVRVENGADATLVEVVAKELDEQGKPKAQEASEGRFFARVPGFLDPEVYTHGRRFTVNGVISDFLARKIGDFAYRYPVVAAEQYHLWAPEPTIVPYRGYQYDPFWDPFWDPWYPSFRRWPYGPYSPYW